MLHNLRYAVRVFAKDFGFAAVAVLTLALGIGANTAIFTVVNALLLRPLPFEHSDRLMDLYATSSTRAIGRGSFSLMRLDQLRSASHSFSNVAGSCAETFNLTGVDEPEQLQAARVSFNFLATLGLHPVLGRDFLPDEDREGGKPVVLLSYGLWQRRFGGNPNIAGTALTLDSVAYTVIGVLPAGLDQPSPALDVLATNLSAFSYFTRDQIRAGGGYITAIARLQPGVSIRQAQAEMDVLTRQYVRDYPARVDASPDARLTVGSLQASVVENVQMQLLILCAAVGAVLLIACANIASLFLARASARRKEFAVRAALGASRGDLIRQLLAESLLLSVISGALGLLIGVAGLRVLSAASQLNPPRVQEIRLDWQALLFTLVVAILTGVITGLIPAMQVSKPDLNTMLRVGQASACQPGGRKNQTRSLLVISQVSLSMILLIAASLLIRSFLELQRVDPGFEWRNVLTLQVSLPAAKYRTAAQQTAFFDQALEKVSAIPGVRSSSAVLRLPLTSRILAPVQAAGAAPLPFASRPLAYWQAITPDFFRTMQIRLVRGRFFNQHDNAASAGAAIVNESMARHYWPNENPIGKRLIIARAEIQAEVVGVVADIRAGGIDAESGNELYSPYAQRSWPAMRIAVSTTGDPRAVANAVHSQIFQVDRDMPVTSVRTMEEILAESFGQRRVTLWLFGAFAVVALFLAAIGIYGLLAYSVAQRRQEMGIRRALGARPADILTLVIREGLGLTMAGVLVGLVGAFAITRLLATLLFHVSPTDPLLFGGMALFFMTVAAIASYLPARRALEVDPLLAMRE